MLTTPLKLHVSADHLHTRLPRQTKFDLKIISHTQNVEEIHIFVMHSQGLAWFCCSIPRSAWFSPSFARRVTKAAPRTLSSGAFSARCRRREAARGAARLPRQRWGDGWCGSAGNTSRRPGMAFMELNWGYLISGKIPR